MNVSKTRIAIKNSLNLFLIEFIQEIIQIGAIKAVNTINKTDIPLAETFAGKGAIRYDDSHQLGAIGATGTKGAVKISKESDIIIGIGTRYSDFTTSSKTAFQNKNVKFINININEFDASKNGALMVQGDAKEVLKELNNLLKNFKVNKSYSNEIKKLNLEWDSIVSNVYNY